jgi:hypothetical protein
MAAIIRDDRSTWLSPLSSLRHGVRAAPTRRSKLKTAPTTAGEALILASSARSRTATCDSLSPLWGNVKSMELANRSPGTIEEAMQAACSGMDRVGNDSDLCLALLRQTGLSL